MKLSFSQWARLGFGAIAWVNRHRDAVDDAIALWQSVVPAEVPEDGITHADALEKVRTGALTPAEQAQFDRASQSSG